MRAEFTALQTAFTLFPTLSGNGSKAVVINSGGTAMTVTTGTLALAGNFATTGAFNLTLALSASVILTLPAGNGTLATLAGTETFTNKTFTSGVVTLDWLVGRDFEVTRNAFVSGYLNLDTGIATPTLLPGVTLYIDSADSKFKAQTSGGILTFPLASGVIATTTGTTTNDSAAVGIIGEYVSSSVAFASAVTLTTLTDAAVTSISLTAGDWDVAGNVLFLPGAATSITSMAAATNTSVALPTAPGAGSSVSQTQAAFVAGAGSQFGFAVGTRRISLASTTTVYLVASAIFTVSTMKAYGFIGARRAR